MPKLKYLIDLIFIMKNKSMIQKETLVPISLYKLFILHENYELFDHYYQRESKFVKNDCSELIKYSLLCSNLRFTIYYSNKYLSNLDYFRHELVQEFLLNVQLYSKISILDKTKYKWSNFEEKLYFFESLLGDITFKNSRRAIKIIDSLLDKDEILTQFPCTLSAKVDKFLKIETNMLYLNSFFIFS